MQVIGTYDYSNSKAYTRRQDYKAFGLTFKSTIAYISDFHMLRYSTNELEEKQEVSAFISVDNLLLSIPGLSRARLINGIRKAKLGKAKTIKSLNEAIEFDYHFPVVILNGEVLYAIDRGLNDILTVIKLKRPYIEALEPLEPFMFEVTNNKGRYVKKKVWR